MNVFRQQHSLWPVECRYPGTNAPFSRVKLVVILKRVEKYFFRQNHDERANVSSPEFREVLIPSNPVTEVHACFLVVSRTKRKLRMYSICRRCVETNPPSRVTKSRSQ